jgi:hypothetical protein
MKNATALISDLILSWKRDNKRGNVRFVVSVNPFTQTMANLADYALNNSYGLDLVGKVDESNKEALSTFLPVADNMIGQEPIQYAVVDALGLPKEVADQHEKYGTYSSDHRLILLSDPNEDEVAFEALSEADFQRIPVRSLLHGLDEVTIQTKEKEYITTMQFDDEPFEEDFGDIDEFDEIDGLGEDDEEFAMPEEELEELELAAEIPTPVVSSDDDGEFTVEKLRALAERDRKAFYDLASTYDLYPGRGVKTDFMINKILEAEGVIVPPAPKKRGRPRKENPVAINMEDLSEVEVFVALASMASKIAERLR